MGHKGGHSTVQHAGYVTQKRVWEVRGDTEMNEGRGPMYTVGYFVDEEIARKAGRAKCAMGTDARPEPKVLDVVVFRDEAGNERIGVIKEFITLDYEDPEEVRQRGLAKLTSAEKKALGL